LPRTSRSAANSRSPSLDSSRAISNSRAAARARLGHAPPARSAIAHSSCQLSRTRLTKSPFGSAACSATVDGRQANRECRAESSFREFACGQLKPSRGGPGQMPQSRRNTRFY
jgi:hypothetical protein